MIDVLLRSDPLILIGLVKIAIYKFLKCFVIFPRGEEPSRLLLNINHRVNVLLMYLRYLLSDLIQVLQPCTLRSCIGSLNRAFLMGLLPWLFPDPINKHLADSFVLHMLSDQLFLVSCRGTPMTVFKLMLYCIVNSRWLFLTGVEYGLSPCGAPIIIVILWIAVKFGVPEALPHLEVRIEHLALPIVVVESRSSFRSENIVGRTMVGVLLLLVRVMEVEVVVIRRGSRLLRRLHLNLILF